LQLSAAFYRKFFGPELPENGGGIAFLAAHTRFILRAATTNEAPRIDRFGVYAARFDAVAVARELVALGARVESTAPERLHFRCPDGLGVELLPVDPARIWGLG
jgi:hypothetical protein